MKHDDLVICDRCGGDACYKIEVTAEVKSYYCMGCGFQASSIMTVGSEFLEEQMSILPELYKALMGEDETGKIWMPTFKRDETGMLYADGTGENNWAWAAVKMIPTTEEDNDLVKKDGYKPDMTTLKHFPEKDFMDALSYLGLLPTNTEE